MQKGRPLIAQSDQSLLLDAHDPSFDEARAELSAFATLEKSPEHMHSYRLDALSLWNAASAGLSADEVVAALSRWSRYELPPSLASGVRETMSRFGRLVLGPGPEPGLLSLRCADPYVRRELDAHKKLGKFLSPDGDGFLVRLTDRGTVKRELIKIGWPAMDAAPLVDGDPHDIRLRDQRPNGQIFGLRPYQEDAVKAFVGQGGRGTGYGVIVMPCGAGKTVVGMAAMAALGRKTLIITTNVAAVHQWIDELLDKTDLSADDIGEYTGSAKNVRPVTVATYQVLTWRPDKDADFPHFELFRRERWGLIIYDEVHLLPAPVFRVVAEIQAIRRLGLTATLIREDGLEEDVFSLIGPKRYDVPWKDLEAKGFIAEAFCREIRVPLPDAERLRYIGAGQRDRHRLAAENPVKERALRDILDNHREDLILVIGQFLDQLRKLAKALNAPLITGQTPNAERERLYREFREGHIHVLVVSKVANFAIDLPDASVAIQVSGTFGSRQEEAQRLGRILRPKARNSHFYSIVTRYTVEEEFADNRRRFLTEQGYRYTIEAWEEGEWEPTL
ncbi:MAG: DEAD/DEAH box helicase [Spirochaetales bacterium]|nr:DEAD/DEAH box helicase [Spirochaetales bacterium]MBP7263678.1 DEAD/DEAH box helicase [Spirochaetia bacterium]